jgi:predicted TIM-barrel fold metal-dependent hydrolase
MSPLQDRIIAVWMQHPTPRLGSAPMFESLRRWVPSTQLAPSVSIPLATTIDAMDAAGVRLGLVCAWWGPRGPLIDNDEVAALVRERPDRLIGVASVDWPGRWLQCENCAARFANRLSRVAHSAMVLEPAAG